MLLEFTILFLTIYFFCAPLGFSYFIGHIGVIVISLSYLPSVSKYLLFWIFLLITTIASQEPRFSVEYFLICSSLLAIGFDKSWSGDSEKFFEKRKKILLFIFLALSITNYFKVEMAERGSLLLWLPVYLALYFEQLNIKNALSYLFFGFLLFLSNKFSTLIAFLFALRSKAIYLISIIAFFAYFLLKQNFLDFFNKSVEPRLLIWKSIFTAFLERPFFGHGFGTFSIDFPAYRMHANILGGRACEQVVHGHNLFAHIAFEQGIVGLFLVFALLYLVCINVKRALLPILLISSFDASLVTFSQYVILSLLVGPFLEKTASVSLFFKSISSTSIQKILSLIVVLLGLAIYIPSLAGHFYYDKGDLDSAIRWDTKNSLYYFERGALNLSNDSLLSEEDLFKAIKLSPHVSYFYGFLGAAQLANGKIVEAKSSLDRAMKLDGKDGYWCLLYAYANYNNKIIYKEYIKKAFKRNPEIKDLLAKADVSAPKYIGLSKGGDVRLSGFYRMGKNIYYPLPVIKDK